MYKPFYDFLSLILFLKKKIMNLIYATFYVYEIRFSLSLCNIENNKLYTHISIQRKKIIIIIYKSLYHIFLMKNNKKKNFFS